MAASMKITMIFLLCFLALGLKSTRAQIEHFLTIEIEEDDRLVPEISLSNDTGIAYLEQLGEKIYFFDFNSFTLTLFNGDTTVYSKTSVQLNLDPVFFWDTQIEDLNIMGMSQYLFDDDDGIEFMVYLTYTPEAFSYSFSRKARYYIIDDDGSQILHRVGSDVIQHPKLLSRESGSMLFIPITNFKTEIYSLPGNIPGPGGITSESSDFIPDTLSAGDRYVLRNIQFDQSSYVIREDVYDDINELTALMLVNPGMVILLEGHTDNQGGAEENMILSENRVKEIKKHLVNGGIKGKRIKIKGYGQTRPIASNDSEETRKLNRRVELVVLKN